MPGAKLLCGGRNSVASEESFHVGGANSGVGKLNLDHNVWNFGGGEGIVNARFESLVRMRERRDWKIEKNMPITC